jgi:hypothetical protein
MLNRPNQLLRHRLNRKRKHKLAVVSSKIRVLKKSAASKKPKDLMIRLTVSLKVFDDRTTGIWSGGSSHQCTIKTMQRASLKT